MMVGRGRFLLFFLLLSGFATALSTAASLSATLDDAQASKSLDCHFVTHIISYVPRDPRILQGPLEKTPTPLFLSATMAGSAFSRTKRGLWRRTSAAQLLPKFAPFDGLRSTNPEAVVEECRRMDDRWEYRVLATLENSGPLGEMVLDTKPAAPIVPRDPQTGAPLPDLAYHYWVGCVLRVDRVLQDGYAIMELTAWDALDPPALGRKLPLPCEAIAHGPPFEEKLGVPTVASAELSQVRELMARQPGDKKPRQVLFPGYMVVVTVTVEERKPRAPYGGYIPEGGVMP